jgi:hypothetical protein
MELNLRKALKTFKIIQSGLIIGALSYLLISLYLNLSEGSLSQNSSEDGFDNTLLIVFNCIAIPCFAASFLVFRMKLKNIKEFSLDEKLKKYQEAMILRAAFIEAPAFSFIVGYLTVGSNIFLIEALACVLLLLFFFPTNRRVSEEIHHDIDSDLRSINTEN